MVKVFCMIVGRVGAFSVKIDLNETVDDLKDRIKEKKMFTFPADELTLYTTKKEEQQEEEEKGGNMSNSSRWLVDDEEHVDMVDLANREGQNHEKYLNKNTKMKATKKLVSYFQTDFEEEEVIHVLVTVPISENEKMEDLIKILKKDGLKITPDQYRHLCGHNQSALRRLQSKSATKAEKRDILIKAVSVIKSATSQCIGLNENIFLDGVLHVPDGQRNSSFFFGFTESGGVMVAKVYKMEGRDSYEREIAANLKIEKGHNVVKFLKHFVVPNPNRYVIVMPFYPRSASDILLQYTKKNLKLPDKTLATILGDCYRALTHIHSKNICFADVKPANIMMECGDPGRAVLVDLGGCVDIGSAIQEYSAPYALDHNITTASENMDWVCLGATLAELAGYEIRGLTKKQLLEKIHETPSCMSGAIKKCLEGNILGLKNDLPVPS
jgi:serine/threonine protein kinase